MELETNLGGVTVSTVQKKFTTLVELAYQVIGPMLDKDPDVRWIDVADKLNAMGHHNSQGNPIKASSLSRAMSDAFPDQRYRRRDKCSKIPYSERAAVTRKTNPIIDPDGIYIEPTMVSNSSTSNGNRGPSVRDSDSPSSVSPKSAVGTILRGEDAEKFWDQQRSDLELQNPIAPILSVQPQYPSDDAPEYEESDPEPTPEDKTDPKAPCVLQRFGLPCDHNHAPLVKPTIWSKVVKFFKSVSKLIVYVIGFGL